jgi:hypothetical protein
MNVFPIGYSSNGAQERIDALLSNPQTLLIDTRIKPYSWDERWRKKELEQKYDERYKWAGKFLGNAALGTGRIEIANPAKGVAGLIRYLKEDNDLVLLCQCREFSTCHVSTICTMLLEKMPEVEVVKFEPSSLGPCAQCGEPAMLRSPSGTVYCSKHGYCARKTCLKSVEKFVLHPRMKIWCCTCVVAFEEQFEMIGR